MQVVGLGDIRIVLVSLHTVLGEEAACKGYGLLWGVLHDVADPAYNQVELTQAHQSLSGVRVQVTELYHRTNVKGDGCTDFVVTETASAGLATKTVVSLYGTGCVPADSGTVNEKILSQSGSLELNHTPAASNVINLWHILSVF
jgi:hypothetical protein